VARERFPRAPRLLRRIASLWQPHPAAMMVSETTPRWVRRTPGRKETCQTKTHRPAHAAGPRARTSSRGGGGAHEGDADECFVARESWFLCRCVLTWKEECQPKTEAPLWRRGLVGLGGLMPTGFASVWQIS
jgi:hypothetical protein